MPVWACDGGSGEWEFQSSAFDNATPEDSSESPDDMSIVLGDTLSALNRMPDDLPVDTAWAGEDWGVAVMVARHLRHEEKQEMRRTPCDDEPAHGDVRGKKNSNRRKRLKQHAQWVVRPAAPPA